MEERIFSIADKYKELRSKKDELQFQLKELNSDIEGVERDLIDEMVAQEVPSFRRNGSMFTVVTKEYPSAVLERKAELYDRMKERGLSLLQNTLMRD